MSHFGRAGPPDIRDTYSLLVLNITFRTTADELFPLFDRYGKVVDIFIPRDRRTGESRGFAFVRYKHVDEAQKAIDRLDGMNIDGRQIAVQFAKYGRNDEKIACGRISTLNSRSRSRSPKRTRRSRDDHDRDRDYREHRHRSRSRDRYERDRSKDGYERDRSKDGYERDRSKDGYERGRSRERYDHDRSRDRYERDRNNNTEREYFRRRSASRSRSRGRYPEEAHRAIRDGSVGRNLSPAPVSPARILSPSPMREEVSRGQSPGPAAEQTTAFQERIRRSGTPEQRSPSPVVQSLSPDAKAASIEKPSASPGPRSPSPSNISPDVQSPYNTDPDES